MIQHIHIENYTLIDHLSIDFEEGFSVITGETGAGKSILLGALSVLLGQRIDANSLFNKDKKSIIEAVFDTTHQDLSAFFEEEDLDYDSSSVIIRREINIQGKSRAFINDTPVNVATLKKIGEKLVDIHSQHSNLLLQDNDFQLLIIDQYARLDKEVNNYKQLFNTWKNKKKQLQTLLDLSGNQDKEYFEFLYNELDTIQIVEGEQQELEEKLRLLSNAEEIRQKLNEVIHILNYDEIHALQLLQDCKQRLFSIEKHSQQLKVLYERFDSILIELKDISKEIAVTAENTTCEQHEIEQLTSRLNALYRLEQKHRVNNDKELIDIKNQLSEKLQTIYNTEISVTGLKETISQTEKELYQLAATISEKRNKTLTHIELALKEKLQSMNMSQAEVKIVLEKQEHLNEKGLDKPVFFFNANKGMELQLMSKIASGGELSRVMLAVKSLILQKNVLPAMVFDEIDSGVSGEVSAKMGRVMQEIARYTQVIAITHLPQIASKATAHYLVYKQDDKAKTYSQIKKLSQQERVTEIAKMISNEEISDSSLQTAQTLLNN
ncbi:MAG: DNA repair protein RecN [Bacteroidales bacterium]|jgi:DNA repair protein RecN (Recombination protein N)|nr:DNA repair protein RecN [Bacteroidales bacterium]